MKYVLFILSVSFLFYTSFIFSNRKDFIGKKIKKIEFKGNINTSKRQIYDFLSMREKKNLTLKMLDVDLKSLYESGFFKEIKIEGELLENDQIKIIFHLIERPKVKDIKFIGVDEVFPNDILDKIPLKINEVVNPQKVRESKEVILKKYEDLGYFFVYIEVELKEIKEENLVIVRFIVDEGEDIPVVKINIYGNVNVNTSEILSVLSLQETKSLDDGSFKIAKYKKDKQAIIAYLKSKGFLDARLDESQTSWNIQWNNPRKKKKRVIVINFKIIEGEKYYFNGYTVNHDYSVDIKNRPIFLNKEKNPPNTPKKNWKPVYSINDIKSYLQFSDYDIGKDFDELTFFKDRAQINQLYSQEGYLFVQVMTNRKTIILNDKSLKLYENCLKSKNLSIQKKCKKDYKTYNIAKLRNLYEKEIQLHDKKFVHIDFLIRENHLAYIENIIIKGNKKTQDKIIRREFLLKHGDLFNSKLVQRSREKIYNLGYFKEVNLNMRPGSDSTKMNLIIDVVEQPTGTINLGGTVGSISGFSIYTELSENNLNGTGQKISGKIEIGPNKRFFQVTWTEPWLYNKPWSLGISSFFSTSKNTVAAIPVSDGDGPFVETATYQRTGVGFSFTLGHKFWINWHHFHSYSPSFYRSSKPSSLASDEVLAEERKGWLFRSSLTNGISYNSLDNLSLPTRGLVTTFSLTNVGQLLGGQTHFDRYQVGFSSYWTLFDYTFGGLFRSHKLKRWKVVQAFKNYNTFTYEKSPAFGREQDKAVTPYISVSDRLFINGFQDLRGWNSINKNYPIAWTDGTSHKTIVRAELRVPIEPSILWFFSFFDAAILFEELGEATGILKDYYMNYNFNVLQTVSESYEDAFFRYNYDVIGRKYPFEKISLNDPSRLVLSRKNLALDRFRYSWGFGLRIQIPVLPLRLFVAQKLRYTNSNVHPFTVYKDDKSFEFGFYIGDTRF